YARKDAAMMCTAFVSGTFSWPEPPPPAPPPPPANFIAYALDRTWLHHCVMFIALYLLARLKAWFPAARGSSGRRLFISMLINASKIVCDNICSNKPWRLVGQGMSSLKEI
ncbi:hypothetical protein BKA62DRAFT_598821, partial [Auriculariales sp. MPI-PUGE-AT-0066]